MAIFTQGKRKIALGWGYLIVCAVINGMAIWTAPEINLMNMAGLAALDTGMATGLGVVVWGNVQEHRCKNGD